MANNEDNKEYHEDFKMIEDAKKASNHDMMILFGIPIYHSVAEYSINEEELKFITSQKTRPNGSNYTSKDSYILDKEPLKKLKEHLNLQLRIYFEGHLNYDRVNNLKITQSWANYTSHGQEHHLHYHKNSVVSGVFYVNYPTPIGFYGDDIWHFRNYDFKKRLDTHNILNSDSWQVQPGVGSTIMFPSSLKHKVPFNSSNETRISIAFNTFPAAEFGNEERLSMVNKL